MSIENEICECEICKSNVEFEIDSFLLDEIRNQNVAIFAGAGVSTENPNSSPHSLYVEMAVGCDIKNCDLPFPDLAQQYSDRPDGRFELMKLIQSRFDYIDKFGDLRRQATKFFRELSTMPYFRTFITTNWDRYFEEFCAAKPFVYDPDMRFWNIPFRRVLKIHGTIDDYSSLIATREDYIICADRLRDSLIGGKLKDILNTHTCIFIGYSMTDDDFKEIFEFVKDRQGKFDKTHYIVSPHLGESTPFSNLIPIRTDGTYFLSTVKQHLCSSDCYLDDEIYDHINDDLQEVEETHFELWETVDIHEHPQMLISAVFQDGLIHGYQFILDMKKEGRHSDMHHLQRILHGYEDKISSYISNKDYLNAAYFRGYQNATVAMLGWADSRKFIGSPMFYYPKIEEMNADEFKERMLELPKIHKSAFRQCQRAVKRLPKDGSMVFQHSPWG